MSFAKDVTAPKVAAGDPAGPVEQGGDGRGSVLLERAGDSLV